MGEMKVATQVGNRETRYNLSRLPRELQDTLIRQRPTLLKSNPLAVNEVHHGDARQLIDRIQPESIALSVWSPPYFVGKSYEAELSFESWQTMLRDVIAGHFQALKPGGFLVINIADILCFKDPLMPKISAEAVGRRRSEVTREDVVLAMRQHPNFNRHQIAALLRCSEQTVDRRLNGNNIRGGKYETQTRVKIVGGMVEEWALTAGLYPYDRRVWVKDAAWENSRWASLSYRAVDEFEYLYFFWKPGVTTVDRGRLTPDEWREWGARGVWEFPSVRANDDHEAKFPLELPLRAIRLLTDPGEAVLDCFMGSGTTALAALASGRDFVGIDSDEKAVRLARTNISRFQRTLFR
jgi:site-specific DNA-methyltransferase (adenine-specific)